MAKSTASVGCTALVSVDDHALSYSFDVTGQQAIDGTAVFGTPCADPPTLAAGTHQVQSLDTDLPIEVDRVVMSDRQPAAAPDAAAAPAAVLTNDGRFTKSVDVEHAPNGCWLVLGNGYSSAWKAIGPDGSLGEPQLVDGGFNGWWIAPSAKPVHVVMEWTQQRKLDIALALSLIGVLLAVALLVVDVRRGAWLASPRRRGPGPLDRCDGVRAAPYGLVDRGRVDGVVSARDRAGMGVGRRGRRRGTRGVPSTAARRADGMGHAHGRRRAGDDP